MKLHLNLLKKLLGDLLCAARHLNTWHYLESNTFVCSACDREWTKSHCVSRSFKKDMEALAEEV